jgi:uncharacterized membrane protein (UPF0127 family)
MRVVHVADEVLGESEAPADRVLAAEVEMAQSTLAHAKGLRFRSSIPDDYAYVMEVGGKSIVPFSDDAARNIVDMFFMRFPIDVVWLRDDEVVKVKTMHPWRSFGLAKADTIIELPEGAADGVNVGDTVRVDGLGGDGEATEEE